tara:strand:- start:169 stop:825 length:657 start_codon:yes stop_codon:yes gene_type:complete
MKKVLVIAPHPDDETLGCGGLLLKHKSLKDKIYCIFLTNFSAKNKNFIKRKKEIQKVAKAYKLNKYFVSKFEPSSLEKIDKKKIIGFMKEIINEIRPDKLLVPFQYDAHHDHKISFECASVFFKSFRYKFIKEVWVYETLSETNFSEGYSLKNFKPNTWVDITKFIKKKIKIFSFYKGEFGFHPHPRSRETLKSLATLRGSYANIKFAEAFQIIKNIV